ncbi:hypothetical protein AYO44_01575 [Planctomycetaceae bacterium SCGC AG-212-F19]|nr:hypothetical protein AYO44_01575 [Planctomycetaceae bacterium SCGC AG-212-F19]
MTRPVHFERQGAPRSQVASSLQFAHRFLRQQLWVWPILAAVLLGGVGWWVNRSVERAMQDTVKGDLTTVLNADVAALRVWLHEQTINTTVLAESPAVVPLARDLIALADQSGTTRAALLENATGAQLRATVQPTLKLFGYQDFMVITPKLRIASAGNDALIGEPVVEDRRELFQKVMHGQASITRPIRSVYPLLDPQGRPRTGLPTILVAAPIRATKGEVLGVLVCRIPPDATFTQLLRVAQTGQSGETYAFDRQGLMVSNSRFDEQLRTLGLLADLPDAQSILTLELRDPGVNMTTGERPTHKRSEQPLTRLAAEAIAGRNGVDVAGYRDYRGVPSVGAWTWLPEYDFGVGTEVDYDEAYRPLGVLRRAFWTLLGLLALCAVGMYAFMFVVARQQRAVQKARKELQQLGQYTLEEKIGEGGMGSVYRARHAFLQRPTAVKLLDIVKVGVEGVTRFEREVRLTSTLCHPNTIAVYDFGSTPEGVFYYAMEFLDGTTLEDLVAEAGPLPEGRAIAILQQICGSLAEAHASGLIHRDIKPANIMITSRGGVPDFVKVLDFGLARAVRGDVRLTAPQTIVGTPQYMAPESIERPETVDARADIYAVGAVGYYLLTGSPVFSGEDTLAVCMQHLQAAPEPPSRRANRPIATDLEALLLWCLAKKPDKRPASMEDLNDELTRCAAAGTWTLANGRAWWKARHTMTTPAAAKASKSTGDSVTQERPQAPGTPGGA